MKKYKGPVVLTDYMENPHGFRSLPSPTGSFPYHLNLEKIIGTAVGKLQDRMAFHMVGDTGSVRHSEFQQTVARTLAAQLADKTEISPAFLYHLGDIVYNFGEAEEYPAQFLSPYNRYDAPIFAIPGNHDGDINPTALNQYESLDAFMQVFCDTKPRRVNFGGSDGRMSMVQPNPYWTLETPLARFIGLYANVTKHGIIDAEQQEWFIEELRTAGTAGNQQAIIVCLHHAPYSADTNHGSSLAMIDFLQHAYSQAGVTPDLVCSGHVHSYQRFQQTLSDGTTIPYIVAGAGGYADLHRVADLDDPSVQALQGDGKTVKLVNYCDDCFGFMKMEIQRTPTGLKIIGQYYTLTAPTDSHARLFDHFEIPLKRSTLSFTR
ncbi:MAG: metallophosphoesterase family protein [Sphingobacteriaceae bacterium]